MIRFLGGAHIVLACLFAVCGAARAANVVDRGMVYFDDNRRYSDEEIIAQKAAQIRARMAEAERPQQRVQEQKNGQVPAVANSSAKESGGRRRMYDDLMAGMLPLDPNEFKDPIKEVPMTLQDVAISVLRNNRTIQVSSFKVDQARADIMGAKSVYDPEAFASWKHNRSAAPPAMIISGQDFPDRKFRNDTMQAGLRQQTPTGAKVSAYREWTSGREGTERSNPEFGHGGSYVMELSQPLLNGFLNAESRAVIEISKLQYDVSDEEFRQTVIETMRDTMTSYWEVVQAREELRISKETLDMAESLLIRERGRKDQGISTQLDVNRAREAAATRAYNLALAQEQYIIAQERLKYQMNNSEVPVGMEIYVDAIEDIEMPLMKVDEGKAINTALENRPEMRNAELAIKVSQSRKRYAKNTLLPELNVVGAVRRNDHGSDTPKAGSSNQTGTDWTVGMEFAMPLGNMKARSNMRKADAELSQTMEDQKNTRDIIVTEVRTAVKSLDLIVREIPLNKRAVEAAARVLDGEWAKLELNQTGNNDLLQAQDLMAVAERNLIQSLIRYNVSIVKLLAYEGTILDRMGVKTRKVVK